MTNFKDELCIREESLSLLSHELKNSLACSKMNAQTGKILIEQGKFEEIKRNNLFDTWLEQIETFENLIDSILDTRAISEGFLFFKPQKIDLNKLLLKITKRFDSKVSYKGISMVGFWDPFRIEQIVTNLITNALKYGKGNPVNVQLLADKAGILKIMVQDFGIGIAPEDREKIFKKFERVNHKSAVRGLGLGLYIVNQIVAAMGGDIFLESEVGIGSTFWVTLPIPKEQE
ncbi:Signal transduction histidine-protein kinase BarA [Legionella quinlivanii]|uniref:histidine kinase n=1 Tax=Legionella quinlivanii TaxID=45073 RepID=A0A0W0Y6R3_9GAMM|nr:HAMP domain-containing sensor histidine kinase [Legionella quinlivanii]KTD52636.1 Signal transduction histidine-protein kinase BarA [Legionella quinlivanii]SEG25870.1 Histidine kinase-, DNA gyrase B-, and HSP90-like ATPase [Legionella quinlivanii DSM 21216]STY10316.1 sensory box histidine kinase/response regulator [Legionella quinlivanii]